MNELKTNAGYLIIKEEFYSKHYGIALGTNQNGFVTWHFKKLDDEPTSYFWGHYITDRSAAMADFYNRLAIEYQNNYEATHKES